MDDGGGTGGDIRHDGEVFQMVGEDAPGLAEAVFYQQMDGFAHGTNVADVRPKQTVDYVAGAVDAETVCIYLRHEARLGREVVAVMAPGGKEEQWHARAEHGEAQHGEDVVQQGARFRQRDGPPVQPFKQQPQRQECGQKRLAKQGAAGTAEAARVLIPAAWWWPWMVSMFVRGAGNAAHSGRCRRNPQR